MSAHRSILKAHPALLLLALGVPLLMIGALVRRPPKDLIGHLHISALLEEGANIVPSNAQVARARASTLRIER